MQKLLNFNKVEDNLSQEAKDLLDALLTTAQLSGSSFARTENHYSEYSSVSYEFYSEQASSYIAMRQYKYGKFDISGFDGVNHKFLIEKEQTPEEMIRAMAKNL